MAKISGRWWNNRFPIMKLAARLYANSKELSKFRSRVYNFPMLIIYTKTGCPWCRDALAFLRDKKVEFEEREVLGDSSYFAELKTKSNQTKTPTLDLDGDILADTDAPAIEAWLKNKKIINN